MRKYYGLKFSKKISTQHDSANIRCYNLARAEEGEAERSQETEA